MNSRLWENAANPWCNMKLLRTVQGLTDPLRSYVRCLYCVPLQSHLLGHGGWYAQTKGSQLSSVILCFVRPNLSHSYRPPILNSARLQAWTKWNTAPYSFSGESANHGETFILSDPMVISQIFQHSPPKFLLIRLASFFSPWKITTFSPCFVWFSSAFRTYFHHILPISIVPFPPLK